jgi:ribosomal protein S27E
MAVEAQLCPQCGSAIHFAEGQTEVVCAYCGTTVVRSSASGSTPVEKEIEAEKLIQETVERERQLNSAGRPATAKILTAQTTDILRSTVEGRAVLMSFVLEVQPADESPFNAETRTLVGLVAVDKYHPGTVLDVRYDPQDHAQVSVEGRHGVPESNPEEQERQQEQQANEMIRKGDEMLRQADEELRQAEEEMRQKRSHPPASRYPT